MRPLVIGIAGGSGSGKTTIAKRVNAALPPTEVTILDHDAYYRDWPDLTYEGRCLLNFDHPDSLETELLVLAPARPAQRGPRAHPDLRLQDPPSLRAGARGRAPTRDDRRGHLASADDALRKELDIRVYVDTDADIRAFRRIRRDIEQRGRTFESVREQYYKTVRPMHLQFVEPSKRWAHVIIPEGGENQVGIDLATALIASHALGDHEFTPQPPRHDSDDPYGG